MNNGRMNATNSRSRCRSSRRKRMLSLGVTLMILPILMGFVQNGRTIRRLVTGVSRSRGTKALDAAAASASDYYHSGGFGRHYVNAYFGNPLQKQTLALSFSADATFLPCSGICKDCGDFQSYSERTFFDPSLSETSTDGTCSLDQNCKISYCNNNKCTANVPFNQFDQTVGNYMGIELSDNVQITDDATVTHQLRHTFHCQEMVYTDSRYKAADGTLSLTASHSSFVSELYDAQQISEKVFSLCFRSFTNGYQKDGTSAGSVKFGSHSIDRPILYAKNNRVDYSKPDNIESNHYGLNVRRVYLAKGGDGTDLLNSLSMPDHKIHIIPLDESHKPTVNDFVQLDNAAIRPESDAAIEEPIDYSLIDGNKGSVIINPSLTESHLHNSIESHFKEVFKKITNGLQFDREGIQVSSERTHMLPSIVLQLEPSWLDQGLLNSFPAGVAGRLDTTNPSDILLVIHPKHYLIPSANDTNNLKPTLRFVNGQSQIGSNFLMEHEVVFDILNNRIGFAEEYNCPPGVSPLDTEDVTQSRSGGDLEDEKEAVTFDLLSNNNDSNGENDININSSGNSELTQDVIDSQKIQNSQNKDGGNNESKNLEDPKAVTSLQVLSDTINHRGDNNDVMSGHVVNGTSANAEQNNAQSPESQEPKVSKKSYDGRNGLPPALREGNSVSRVGKAGLASSRKKREQENIMDYGGLWNLLGFFCFFSGFVITAFATRDPEKSGVERNFTGHIEGGVSDRYKTATGSVGGDGSYAASSRSMNDDSRTLFTYSGARSVYPTTNNAILKKDDATVATASDSSGSGRYPWKRGPGTVGTDPSGSTYDGTSYYSNSSYTRSADDRTYYTKSADDATYYTRGADDATYYTRGADDATYYTEATKDEYTRADTYTEDAYTRADDQTEAYTNHDYREDANDGQTSVLVGQQYSEGQPTVYYEDDSTRYSATSGGGQSSVRFDDQQSSEGQPAVYCEDEAGSRPSVHYGDGTSSGTYANADSYARADDYRGDADDGQTSLPVSDQQYSEGQPTVCYEDGSTRYSAGSGGGQSSAHYSDQQYSEGRPTVYYEDESTRYSAGSGGGQSSAHFDDQQYSEERPAVYYEDESGSRPSVHYGDGTSSGTDSYYSS